MVKIMRVCQGAKSVMVLTKAPEFQARKRAKNTGNQQNEVPHCSALPYPECNKDFSNTFEYVL